MLQKVVIEHFRSCENVTIDDIGPSLVLVGPNGSGKTNILKAILWAAKSALAEGPLGERAPTAITLDFRVGEDVFRYAISFPLPEQIPAVEVPIWGPFLKESLSVSGPGDDWTEIVGRAGSNLGLSGRSPLTVPPGTPSLFLLFTLLPPGDPLLGRLVPVRDFLRRVRYYPFDEPSESAEPIDFISETRYEQWSAKRDEFGRTEADSVLMKLLCLWKEAKEDFEEVEAILGPNGLDLIDSISVQAYSVPKQGGGGVHEAIYFPSFRPLSRGEAEPGRGANGSSPSFQFADLSQGTRRVIRMIVSMIFDKGAVMLIEHPEDGIHRWLTEKVFSTLRTYTDPTQILVSSHSPLVFNMLDPEEIRVVTMSERKTEVRALTAEEAAQARRYVKEQGTMTEYLGLMIEV